MRYFVFAPNGQRYGPADLATLQQWAAEGRILPASVVENEQTLVQMPAQSIPGLTFPMSATMGPTQTGGPANFEVPTTQVPFEHFSAPPQSPQQIQSNYYRAMPQDYANSQDVTNAWICFVVSILCLPPLTILGMVLANRAKKVGNPHAQAPYIANLVYTCIWGLGCIFYLGIFGLAFAAGGFN